MQSKTDNAETNHREPVNGNVDLRSQQPAEIGYPITSLVRVEHKE